MSSTTTEGTATVLPAELCAAVEARIQERRLDLPLLPDAAAQVLALTLQEECDSATLTRLIHRDQALAAHVLRIANSVLYAPKVPIVSLDQAIPRLGLRRIREIAYIIACESRVFRVKGHEERMRAERRHALAAALAGQEIARILRASVEESFLCGLLHDAGRPVILQLVLDLSTRSRLPCEAAVLEESMDRWHAQAGFALAQAWSLPHKVTMATLHHHDPVRAEGHVQAAAIAALADGLAHDFLGTPGPAPGVRDGLSATLNLYPDDIEALGARRDEVLKAVESLG